MPSPPRPLPAVLGDVFSTAQALTQGLSRRRLRAGDLLSPYFRVRRRADSVALEEKEAEEDTRPYAQSRNQCRTIMGKMRAYATAMSPGSFYCGRSAAVVHNRPIEHPGDLEVAVIAPRRAPRGKGIKGRKIAAPLVTIHEIEGLRVSSPASTWAILCRDLSERELIALGDAIVQVPRDEYGIPHPESALATITELRAAADAGPRPPATGRLRMALGKVRVGSSSPLETDLRLDAAAGGLPEPELDVEIRGPDGRLLGISEFAYPEFRLIIEVEGDHHRSSSRQWNRDIDKYRAYSTAGWETVRLTSKHIRGTHPTAVGIIHEALRRRGWAG